MTVIVPIVEGHGELEAVPTLLFRIAGSSGTGRVLRVKKPIRVSAPGFINNAETFRRYFGAAAIKAKAENGAVLILLDCDGAGELRCPATLGPRLKAQAMALRPDVTVLIALAKMEYEAWFIAASASLTGVHGYSHVTEAADPEGIRDAKGWLGRNMPAGYDPVAHQPAFTQRFDLMAARRAPSFDRLCARVAALLGASPEAAPC